MSSSDTEPILGNGNAQPRTVNKSFAHKKVKAYSISTLILAILVFLTGVGLLVLTAITHSSWGYRCSPINPGYMANGIWCGILFGAAAIVGLKAAKYQSTCYIVALMVLSTLSATFACIQLVVGILGAARCSLYGNLGYYILGCNVFLAVLGLVEMVLFTLSAASSCRSTCCDTSLDFMTEVLQAKKQRNERVPQQPAPLVPGSQIVYAPSGSGSDLKPFLMVPITQPEMLANVKSQAFHQVMMPVPRADSEISGVSAPPDQGDQPLIKT